MCWLVGPPCHISSRPSAAGCLEGREIGVGGVVHSLVREGIEHHSVEHFRSEHYYGTISFARLISASPKPGTDSRSGSDVTETCRYCPSTNER